MVAALVQVGTTLGLSVIAEGIQTELETALLVECGCQYGQGELSRIRRDARLLDSGFCPPATPRARWATALTAERPPGRWAIRNRELRLDFQPIVELETDAVVGYEALVRWQHPRRGTPRAARLPADRATQRDRRRHRRLGAARGLPAGEPLGPDRPLDDHLRERHARAIRARRVRRAGRDHAGHAPGSSRTASSSRSPNGASSSTSARRATRSPR